MNATNAVVEGRLEPMARTPDTPRVNVTGQWLWDNFVVSGEEQVSRMNMVRILSTQATDDELKVALKDMVEIAHKHDVKAGIDEKVRGPKRAQAMNARSVMQNAYGALRRANAELIALGYTEKTGYQEMRVLAASALKSKGIKWNGTQIPNAEQKLAAQAAAEKQAKTDAFSKARGELDQAEGEEDFAYFTRLNGRANEILMESKQEALKRVASKIVVDIDTKHGRDIARLVLERLTAFLAETSEMTDEEASAALRAHAELEAEEEAVQAELDAEMEA